MFCRRKHFNVDYFRKMRQHEEEWNDFNSEHTVFIETINGTTYGVCRIIVPVQDFGSIDRYTTGNISKVIEEQQQEVVMDGFYIYKVSRRGAIRWLTYHVFTDLNSAIQAIDYFSRGGAVFKRATLVVRHIHHLQMITSFMCFHENGTRFMCVSVDHMPMKVLKRLKKGAMFYANVNVDAPSEKYLVAKDWEVTTKSSYRGRDIRNIY